MNVTSSAAHLVDRVRDRLRRDAGRRLVRGTTCPAEPGIQGWLRAEESHLLYYLGRITTGDGAEIGSWCGRSAYYISSGIRDRSTKTGKLLCIDTFDGNDPETRLHLEKLGLETTLELFEQGLSQHGLRSFVEPRVGTSLAIAADVQPESLAFVFLDGDHSYANTHADATAWIPKVRVGGFVAFHDAPRPEVRPVWARDFRHQLKPLWLLDGTLVCRRQS